MRLLITGSRGFVGKALCKRLKNSSIDIIEADIILGHDVAKSDSLSFLPEFDIVIHLAARIFVPESYIFPSLFYQTNVIGTLNILELCRRYKARMIYISSYVYGSPEYLPIDEIHPVKAFNPYSQSKLMGEELCKAYNRDFEIPVTIFRPFNIYGPGQNQSFLVPHIIEQANSGQINLEDPRPKRDFIYIDDVVNAYEKAINMQFSGVEILNLGSGVSVSIHELTKIIKQKIKSDISVVFSGEQRKNEVLETIANIDKIKSYLDWSPEFSVEKGIDTMING